MAWSSSFPFGGPAGFGSRAHCWWRVLHSRWVLDPGTEMVGSAVVWVKMHNHPAAEPGLPPSSWPSWLPSLPFDPASPSCALPMRLQTSSQMMSLAAKRRPVADVSLPSSSPFDPSSLSCASPMHLSTNHWTTCLVWVACRYHLGQSWKPGLRQQQNQCHTIDFPLHR